MTVARSISAGRAGLVAVLIAGTFAATGQAAARAGGTPGAQCPGGQEFELAAAGDEPYPGPPVRLEGGYYAHTASFWPPRSALLCRTESGTDQPSPEIADTTGLACPSGATELVVPNEIPADFETPVVAESGALLPAGWYTLPSLDPDAAPAGTASAVPADPTAPEDIADPGASTDPTAPAVPADQAVPAGTAPERIALGSGGTTPSADSAGAVVWTTVCWSQTEPSAPAA